MQTAIWNGSGRGGAVANGGVVPGDEAGPLNRRRKRKGDDSNLSDYERFTKRLNLLSLGAGQNANSNYYIPLSTSPKPASTTPNGGNSNNNDFMDIEDTRDRVYIRDLDEELADTESDEEKLIFLPDIEKRLSKLPSQVLTGRRDDDHEGQELVLYSVPKSLTVHEEQDSVRKAIIESRKRAQERAVEEARHQDMIRQYDQSGMIAHTETAHGYSNGYVEEQTSEELDPDAMEMD